MRKDVNFLIGVMMLAAALALPAAHASAPQPASGDFAVQDLVVNSMEPKGETCHIELTATFSLEGTFNGEFVADFQIVHLGACGEPADEVFIARGTFTGDVDGATGSFDFVFTGTIDATGAADGDLVITRGTDELAGLSGRINLTGTAGVSGKYTGRVHPAP